jgi:hypothetical protein
MEKLITKYKLIEKIKRIKDSGDIHYIDSKQFRKVNSIDLLIDKCLKQIKQAKKNNEELTRFFIKESLPNDYILTHLMHDVIIDYTTNECVFYINQYNITNIKELIDSAKELLYENNKNNKYPKSLYLDYLNHLIFSEIRGGLCSGSYYNIFPVATLNLDDSNFDEYFIKIMNKHCSVLLDRSKQNNTKISLLVSRQ